MKNYLMINGNRIIPIEAETLKDAIYRAINLADHSQKLTVKEIKIQPSKPCTDQHKDNI
jgi:hypothetical protein